LQTKAPLFKQRGLRQIPFCYEAHLGIVLQSSHFSKNQISFELGAKTSHYRQVPT